MDESKEQEEPAEEKRDGVKRRHYDSSGKKANQTGRDDTRMF